MYLIGLIKNFGFLVNQQLSATLFPSFPAPLNGAVSPIFSSLSETAKKRSVVYDGYSIAYKLQIFLTVVNDQGGLKWTATSVENIALADIFSSFCSCVLNKIGLN